MGCVTCVSDAVFFTGKALTMCSVGRDGMEAPMSNVNHVLRGTRNLPKIGNWQIEGRRWSRNTDGYNETTKTQNLLFKRVASGQLHDQRLISKRAITVSGKFVVVGGLFTVLSWILIDSRY